MKLYLRTTYVSCFRFHECFTMLYQYQLSILWNSSCLIETVQTPDTLISVILLIFPREQISLRTSFNMTAGWRDTPQARGGSYPVAVIPFWDGERDGIQSVHPGFFNQSNLLQQLLLTPGCLNSFITFFYEPVSSSWWKYFVVWLRGYLIFYELNMRKIICTHLVTWSYTDCNCDITLWCILSLYMVSWSQTDTETDPCLDGGC